MENKKRVICSVSLKPLYLAFKNILLEPNSFCLVLINKDNYIKQLISN